MRKIIHIDMDAFYASVEQRDDPELRGKPVAVGGGRERGVVAAASYEAREFGVHSAMPSVVAARKCPDLIFVKPRFDHYRAISQEIREIFREYTDLIEPLSLDEAYLDVTENKVGLPSATLIAREIKDKIYQRTQLRASAGISINKFLAKTASDMDKPDGLHVIHPGEVEQFMEELEVKEFFGVGRVTAEKMHGMGIHTGKDLKQLSREEMWAAFGKFGTFLYNVCRGIDDRPVNPNRIRKSIGAERTFQEDVITIQGCLQELEVIADKVLQRIEKAGRSGKTLTVKIKFSDFSQITRSRTLATEVRNKEQMMRTAREVMEELAGKEFAIRLLGLTVSNLTKPNEADKQLTLVF